jgi:predicted dehydrogenase
MGMVVGGGKCFIGAIHRIAANIDGLIELQVLLVPIPKYQKNQECFFLPEEKCYGTYQEMFLTKAFAKRGTDGFCHYCNPNFAHFAPAMAALEHGFNVIIDKPITLTLEEAKNWKKS